MSNVDYNVQDRDRLLRTAADSIDYGVFRGEPLPIVPDQFSAPLRQPGASFVTLHLDGALRGCIGTTEAYRPLIQDVAQNAFAASQRDPRFSPLTAKEVPNVKLSLSILTLPEPLQFRDEEHLLEQLTPGRDGLIIEDGPHRATFLPQVWQQVPEKHEFLAHLKRKAGLRDGTKSSFLTAQRYQVLHLS